MAIEKKDAEWIPPCYKSNNCRSLSTFFLIDYPLLKEPLSNTTKKSLFLVVSSISK